MTNSAHDATQPASGASLCILTQRVNGALERIPYSFIALGARIFPVAVFWQSGQTKLEGWRVLENAIYLFKEDYKLPLRDPVVAAHAPRSWSMFFRFCSCSVSRAGSPRRRCSHDAGDRNLRLSRRMADAWRLGDLPAARRRARTRRHFDRSPAAAPLRAPVRTARQADSEIFVTRPSANHCARKPAVRRNKVSSLF
jgi:hypothetical protein